MAIQVNIDGANNVFIGGTVATKSTAQDMVDSLQTFVTSMNTLNWGAGARSTNATITTMGNVQFEWRPSATTYPSETLTTTLSNFTAGTTITNAGARFKTAPFNVRGLCRTSSAIAFPVVGLSATLGNVAGTDTYKIVGDKHGVVGFYSNNINRTLLTWVGNPVNTEGTFSIYGNSFSHIGVGNLATSNTGNKSLRIGATTVISLALEQGVADYPIICANGSTPNLSLWATDFYIRENDTVFNYSVVGKISNILLGRGGFILNNYYRLTVPDVNGASPVFQCAATLGSRFLLVRVFEQTP